MICTTFETFEHSASCDIWPSAAAVGFGSHTRSSLQIGTTSTENVYFCLPLPVCVSSEMTCFETFMRTGAIVWKNETIFSACERWSK